MADDHIIRTGAVTDEGLFAEQGYSAVSLFEPELGRGAQTYIAEHIERVSRAHYLPF